VTLQPAVPTPGDAPTLPAQPDKGPSSVRVEESTVARKDLTDQVVALQALGPMIEEAQMLLVQPPEGDPWGAHDAPVDWAQLVSREHLPPKEVKFAPVLYTPEEMYSRLLQLSQDFSSTGVEKSIPRPRDFTFRPAGPRAGVPQSGQLDTHVEKPVQDGLLDGGDAPCSEDAASEEVAVDQPASEDVLPERERAQPTERVPAPDLKCDQPRPEDAPLEAPAQGFQPAPSPAESVGAPDPEDLLPLYQPEVVLRLREPKPAPWHGVASELPSSLRPEPRIRLKMSL